MISGLGRVQSVAVDGLLAGSSLLKQLPETADISC
jgi:hypothetical protein